MEVVPFELAKKLKEKGFKEKCVAYYWEKINEHTPSFLVEDNMPEDGICILDLISEHNKSEWSPFIDAPTISQVLKWLREEKKIFIDIDIRKDLSWFFEIRSIEISLHPLGCVPYQKEQSYEQAAIAGIEYYLDNFI